MGSSQGFLLERSITRAAQHLRMFQPLVTRNIPQLEHQIKAKDMIDGQKRKPFMTVNSAECLAHAAEQGIGIIACSHDSLLLKKYALKRVLPTIEGQPTKMYYVYPKSIRNLSTVGLLGNYLKNALSFPQNITN